MNHCIKCGNAYDAAATDEISNMECPTCRMTASQESPAGLDGRIILENVLDFFFLDEEPKAEAASAAKETHEGGTSDKEKPDLDLDLDLDSDIDLGFDLDLF